MRVRRRRRWDRARFHVGFRRAMPAPREVEWHERVRAALDFKIENPNFFLWIGVTAAPDARLDEPALQRDVEAWLGRLDPDRVFHDRDEPEHTWDASGLLVRLTAIPKKAEARAVGGPVVGNPAPPDAYRSGVVRAGTGVPVMDAEPPSAHRRGPPRLS
jgi:hypothetical protein